MRVVLREFQIQLAGTQRNFPVPTSNFNCGGKGHGSFSTKDGGIKGRQADQLEAVGGAGRGPEQREPDD